MDENYINWIGVKTSNTDIVDVSRVRRMYLTLDLEGPEHLESQALPSLWHWMFFAPEVRFSEVGDDGHPKRGGFLPPIELPRRMWAGGRLTFHRPLMVGEKVFRESTIKNIKAKSGRTGDMVFVTVSHEISTNNGIAITEEHDIVYRELSNKGVSATTYRQASLESDFSKRITPHPVTLFRYSALTFNGHRIHYDRKYCNEVEGYPGLVFHGPLTATYLALLLEEENNGRRFSSFDFRAVKPLFDTHSFMIHARTQDETVYNLWTCDHEGHINMEATATYDD